MRSELCIHDIATGDTSVILTHDGIIEAPNWHPDGFLLVNGDGRLWRVPLDEPRLEPFPTGRIGQLNNDHGLSPDGRTLAISGKTETEKSCIYCMPITGGEPVRVTEKVPSWWHSWSPDGQRLAYAGVRRDGAPVSLYTCALDGSDEVCVADDFDHIDGPDYSADGRWIWFNGEKDGRVDLWRIRPDGSDRERMTGGETVDWFPHPSPDGRHVVYIAYPPGTRGHPAGLNVTLRLLPQEGGESRELLPLFGGQGTMNVPCWAPDSRRFAFMRFAP
ncbi:TolB family protein [Rubellimicrobium arenae]|uniref:TolB family protein n=1 Tax=Rubellimicrobium arenae TaxID=2817372 RepID=UPI001B307D39|nr:PD40 domain-containing protein [Rubellimicrobium arenae]